MSLHRRALARHAEDLRANPGLLTPGESVARALALGAFWGTGACAAALVLQVGVPAPVLAVAFAYGWAQGGVAWAWYRRSRRARGVSVRLFRPV